MPDTLSAIRDLIASLRNWDKKTAKFVLENLDSMISGPISELAAKAESSESSLIRLWGHRGLCRNKGSLWQGEAIFGG
jgi:DNA-binding MurR/RpiR family transcriptional regulator